MILKGSQRGGGQNLAVHLMRMDDNDHVRVHELRGFASDDLKGAFKEVEAVSLGTKCRQYLFSLSINPPEDQTIPAEEFESTIDRIEERLGLTGQPRAIVLHEKNARLHAHCVWSRIDTGTMTARPMSFFKRKLTGLSRELYLEHGWDMPRGLISPSGRNPTNFTLAEWQQAKRLQQDPRWMKQVVRDCWARSDNRKSFEQGLSEHALFLARGDRRGFIVMDHAGQVQSLTRTLGLKTKELAARLGDPEALRDLNAAKAEAAKLLTPAMQRHVKESRAAFDARAKVLAGYRAEMVAHHRAARETMSARQAETRRRETAIRAARLPKGLSGLWHRITGKYQQIRRENEREANLMARSHAGERQELVEKQMDQRRVLEARIKELRESQAERLRDLRREMGRYLGFHLRQGFGGQVARGHDASAARTAERSRAPGSSLTLKLER